MSIGAPFPKNVNSFDKDPTYQIMKEQMLKFISNIKYKLYILDAIPRINRKIIEEIVPFFRNHTDLEKIDVSSNRKRDPQIDFFRTFSSNRTTLKWHEEDMRS